MKYSMSLCLIHPIDSVDLVGGVSVGGAMPCAEINSSFCVHGTCEMKNGLARASMTHKHAQVMYCSK